jgi:hypothetical protein
LEIGQALAASHPLATLVLSGETVRETTAIAI